MKFFYDAELTQPVTADPVLELVSEDKPRKEIDLWRGDGLPCVAVLQEDGKTYLVKEKTSGD